MSSMLPYKCQTCKTSFLLSSEKKPSYCITCGTLLSQETAPFFLKSIEDSVSLAPEKFSENDVQFTIGPYQVLRSIGKGGMGEVFLAYDTSCGRKLALKRIRPDLITFPHLQERFLREARITCQLTHPSIIPIYHIHNEENLIYYTMPYVEGYTLKQIFLSARNREKQGLKPEDQGSIPSLIRLFLNICQAVAYAHAKNIVHRDLKANNIIVGRYGEVMILDWGLAKLIKDKENELSNLPQPVIEESKELTRFGKVVGTVSYMAPERALGNPATFQTDIYSLGVILYQILTLQHPFKRSSLKQFRKILHKEELLDPTEVAPYRDVPPILSRVVETCLEKNLELRFSSVDQLIQEIEGYIEGRSKWLFINTLSIKNRSDWEFQENILIAEYIAITRGTDFVDWVSLMVSKSSYTGNTKIEVKVCLGKEGQGIGFLLSIPEVSERKYLNSGFSLWIASDLNKNTYLLRSTVEVIHAPEIFLEREMWYDIRIEKIENNIHFFLNNQLKFSYISHLPLSGTHIGVYSRDADFELQDLNVYIGSKNITVNCLAIPDAFLAHKDYTTALSEYRRIGYAFPGTAEARQALFRAGITLLEEAKNILDFDESQKIYEAALQEFDKLHNTPGAPLEYLGKALVYQQLGELEEELKCFELVYRRYPNHPLLSALQEQLIHRMNECARSNRKSTYEFTLLAIRFIPGFTKNLHAKRFLNSLKNHWETLPFIEENNSLEDSFTIPLAFWLSKTYVLLELLQNTKNIKTAGNILFALLELKKIQEAKEGWNTLPKEMRDELFYIEILLQSDHLSPDQLLNKIIRKNQSFPRLIFPSLRVIEYVLTLLLEQNHFSSLHIFCQSLREMKLPKFEQLRIDGYEIWSYLKEKNTKAAGNLLHEYTLEELTDEKTLLHFLYGCWLYISEGREITRAHWSSVLEIPFPRTWNLFSCFFESEKERIDLWLEKAFIWEKQQFYRQKALFYRCKNNIEKEEYYIQLIEKLFNLE